MSKVFISYRRDDTSGYAGRINSRVERAVGKDNVFQDVADIAPGKQWDVAIAEAMAQCDIQLVLVGPRFLDETNGPRLHQEDDLLRQEIVAGLRSASTRVVPVRVGGAALPTAEELPADLARFPTRQDFELRDRSFDGDLRDLLQRLGLRRLSPMLIGGGVLAAIALIVLGIILFGGDGDGDDASATTTRPATTTTGPTTTATTTPPTTTGAPAAPFPLGNFVGIDADAAQASLESLELRVRRTLEQSVDIPAGVVIRHVPTGGTEVVDGDEVELVVSTGPPDVVVPEVANVLSDTAVRRLENESLRVETRSIASGLVGAGRVIRTNPPAGTTVPAGSDVEALVSSGPAPGCSTLFAGNSATIGLSGNFPTDETGSPVGFDIELIRAVIDEMCGTDVGFQYVQLTAADRFGAVSSGLVDLLPTSKRSGTVFLLYTTPYVLLDGGTPMGLAIRANLTDERLQLNAALLEVIDSGRWLELHREWLGDPTYTVNEMLETPLVED